MSFADHFRTPPTPRERSVEESLADRAHELRVELARLDAEGEALSSRMVEFRRAHKTMDGNFLASSLAQLGNLPDMERQMRQEEFMLYQRRSAVLSELAALTVNEKESVHVEGRLVDRA